MIDLTSRPRHAKASLHVRHVDNVAVLLVDKTNFSKQLHVCRKGTDGPFITFALSLCMFIITKYFAN